MSQNWQILRCECQGTKEELQMASSPYFLWGCNGLISALQMQILNNLNLWYLQLKYALRQNLACQLFSNSETRIALTRIRVPGGQRRTKMNRWGDRRFLQYCYFRMLMHVSVFWCTRMVTDSFAINWIISQIDWREAKKEKNPPYLRRVLET